MGKIGLQKKQRPGHDGIVRTASGLDGGMPNLPPNAQPYTAIPPHMQAQMQNFNFDQVGENQSMISNTVISEPCTNKRSKPEMASSSQIGLRSVFLKFFFEKSKIPDFQNFLDRRDFQTVDFFVENFSPARL